METIDLGGTFCPVTKFLAHTGVMLDACDGLMA